MLSTPRILSEHLAPLAEPLACLLAPAAVAPPASVAAIGARALLDLAPLALEGQAPWPAWLASHQAPAATRLVGILARHGGALLADAVGLGKSYVALAVALALGAPFTLVVPAVLVDQWRALLKEHGAEAPIFTHESLSAPSHRPLPSSAARCRLWIIDEAHRFRNPGTRRYRALARLVVGANVLLVTATPVHNRLGDLCHLFRLFLRDHDLTALGVPSLLRAARGDCDARALTAAAARLSVSRSRARVRSGYDTGRVALDFPQRAAGRSLRVGCAPDAVLAELVEGVARLEAGRDAAVLFRLVLLSQLASSLPAFRASLGRYEAFLDLGAAAAAQGKTLGRDDFRRLFPAGAEDLQLVLLPLVLQSGPFLATERDRDLVRKLRELSRSDIDPKAEALERLLNEGGKTIVFVQARATLHHLMRWLRGRRVAGVAGDRGWFGSEAARRDEVIRAFAPLAQGAPAPSAALATDVLIVTDLLSEGLNLQDAARVVHYDLPWSPARLAQREGRIDRAASPHPRIETVAFRPPRPLAAALAVERRLAAKRRVQARAGGGREGFDWCDRLQGIATTLPPPAPHRSWTAIVAPERAAVLVIRIGGRVEGFVGTDAGVRADPEQAAVLLERAARAELAPDAPTHRPFLDRMLRQVRPLCRRRLDTIEATRWRAADRDRLSRRLIPWVLSAARRAAVQRRPADLRRLDELVSRLALGMTAGEELLLEDLVTRRTALSVRDVLAWHERLRPPLPTEDVAVPQVELVAAVVFGPA